MATHLRNYNYINVPLFHEIFLSIIRRDTHVYYVCLLNSLHIIHDMYEIIHNPISMRVLWYINEDILPLDGSLFRPLYFEKILSYT